MGACFGLHRFWSKANRNTEQQLGPSVFLMHALKRSVLCAHPLKDAHRLSIMKSIKEQCARQFPVSRQKHYVHHVGAAAVLWNGTVPFPFFSAPPGTRLAPLASATQRRRGRPYPRRPGSCSSPASHLCRASSAQGPAAPTPPW